jgi:hypothetical protein
MVLQEEGQGQEVVTVLLGASAGVASPPSPLQPQPQPQPQSLSQSGSCGRKSFADQDDFVPLVSMEAGSGDDGEEGEEEEAVLAAMGESVSGGGDSGVKEGKGEVGCDKEAGGEEGGAASRYFVAHQLQPPPTATEGGPAAVVKPTAELEGAVAAHPSDAEAWLALAARRLLLATASGPTGGQEEEAGAVEAALQALGVATEQEALAACLLRLEEKGRGEKREDLEEGKGADATGAAAGEALRPALRVLARALDTLASGSREGAVGPWLLYLRLYTALPTGGARPRRLPMGLLEEGKEEAGEAAMAAGAAGASPPLLPVGALSPSVAGKADALLEAARDHSPGCLPLWRAAEAYHRLCRAPMEAAAAEEQGGANEPLLARVLRFHSGALVALLPQQPPPRGGGGSSGGGDNNNDGPSDVAAPVALLLLLRARCLLHAGHGGEAVRTLAVPLGALTQHHHDLAGALLHNDQDAAHPQQQLEGAAALFSPLPPNAPWQAALSTSTSALLLWAALLHLTAFGCLPPAAIDILSVPTPATAAFALLAWHPTDGPALEGNAAVRMAAAAYRSWAGAGQQEQQEQHEEGEEGGVLRAVLGWNLSVLSPPGPSREQAPSVGPAALPVWVVWGLGRLSTLQPALRLAAVHGWGGVVDAGGGGSSLWRHIMPMPSGEVAMSSSLRLPAPELTAARIGLLVACFDPDAAAMGAHGPLLPAGRGEEQRVLVMARDALSHLLGRGPAVAATMTTTAAAAAAVAAVATLPARSLEEDVVFLGEALLKAVSKDPASTAGARALAALLLARLRLRCCGSGGPGTATAGLRQHLLTTAAGPGAGALERAVLWLELLALLRGRWQEQQQQQQQAHDIGSRTRGSGGGGASAASSSSSSSSPLQQQVESALTAAVRAVMTVALPGPTTITTYGAAVLWALDGRPRHRRMGALAAEALIQGMLGLSRWGENSTTACTSSAPDPLPLLERCLLPLCTPPSPTCPPALPSGALVVLSHALLAQGLGRPSRAGSLLRLRAALRPRLMQRLRGGGAGGGGGSSSSGGGAWGFVDDEEQGSGAAAAAAAAAGEALCLAQTELALQEPGQAQLALERGLLLDPLAAGPWAALLQLEACFGGDGGRRGPGGGEDCEGAVERGGGGGGGKEGGWRRQWQRQRLRCLVKGLRTTGVQAPLLPPG